MSNPVYWEPKDPDEAKSYQLIWWKDGEPSGLRDGDTVLTSEWSEITGVVKEAQSVAPDGLSTYVHLSGGADGVIASLLNTVTTTQGETLEQIVLLPIVANTTAALEPYALPTPAHLIARYPKFATVPYGTIAIHINDALGGVDTSWAAADYHPALLSLAAHNMSLLGLVDEGELAAWARAGITSIRDGAFSASFSEKKAAAAAEGGLAATPYGQAYRTLLRRNKGGPRLVGGGLGDQGWGPLAVQNNGGVLPWAY